MRKKDKFFLGHLELLEGTISNFIFLSFIFLVLIIIEFWAFVFIGMCTQGRWVKYHYATARTNLILISKGKSVDLKIVINKILSLLSVKHFLCGSQSYCSKSVTYENA